MAAWIARLNLPGCSSRSTRLLHSAGFVTGRFETLRGLLAASRLLGGPRRRVSLDQSQKVSFHQQSQKPPHHQQSQKPPLHHQRQKPPLHHQRQRISLHQGQIHSSTRAAMPSAKPQAVDAPLTQSATFLILTVSHTPSALATVRTTIAGLSGLAKSVAVRDTTASFACTVGIGSAIWDDLTRLPRPAELRPFRAVAGAVHTAVSTPGDLLFHIRSDRRDICFEFERQLMKLLGDSVRVEDSTVGFRYFDLRDLLGFVDGTANPVGPAVPDAVLVAHEDAPCAGGSYVVVQKYLHDLKAWEALAAETQEAIVGRTKMDNIELEDAAPDAQKSHKTLATVQDDEGNEHDILRDNMPFGSPGEAEYGTYFIGYSRRLWVTERMLERMFVGDPPGKHDRILDYSRATTGLTFFAPSADVLAGLDAD